MKFEYWKGKDGWRFHLKAANGEIVMASESYTSKQSCLGTITEIKRVVGYAEVFAKCLCRRRAKAK